MKLFSRRNAPAADSFRYDIPQNVRSRLLHTLKRHLEDPLGLTHCIQDYSYEHTLEEVGKNLVAKYGGLKAPGNARSHGEAAMHHLLKCDDEEVLDFLEAVFQVYPQVQQVRECVGPVNDIFQEEGIGYELTPFRETVGEPVVNRDGGLGGQWITYDFPKAVRKDTEYLHSEVVRPCLEALGRPGFETAHAEMMKAHEAYRRGQYADAITDAASSFESVMKTICAGKGWAFNPDTDTCRTLAKALATNGLFYSFYTTLFEAVGTVRNKMSDAHGRGPTPQFEADKEYADHMIQFTSANITMMVKKSGL